MSQSILKYFTVRLHSSLTNPNELLSTRISPTAISSANEEVRLVLTERASSENCVQSRKGKKLRVYSPETRAEIGRMALNIGPTAAAKRVSRKLGFQGNWGFRSMKALHVDLRSSI